MKDFLWFLAMVTCMIEMQAIAFKEENLTKKDYRKIARPVSPLQISKSKSQAKEPLKDNEPQETVGPESEDVPRFVPDPEESLEDNANQDEIPTNDDFYSTSPSPSFSKRIHFFGFFAISQQRFQGSLGADYLINQYLVSRGLVSYWRIYNDSQNTTAYAPEFQQRLRIPNPSPFTPYVGLLTGYEYWNQLFDHERIQYDLKSLTVGFLYGLNIRLNQYFSFVIERQHKQFLNRTPIKHYTDEKNIERYENPLIHTEIHFLVSF